MTTTPALPRPGRRTVLRCGALIAAPALLGLARANDPSRPLDVPYVPTPEAVVEGMMKLARVKRGDVLYDLGCGDGRVVIAAAKLGARGVDDGHVDTVAEPRQIAHELVLVATIATQQRQHILRVEVFRQRRLPAMRCAPPRTPSAWRPRRGHRGTGTPPPRT